MASPTILIIDDDTAICASLSIVLRRAGYQHEAVSNHRKALEKFNQLKPDLVLLDMNFSIDTSGRQGMQMLREIKAINAKQAVILMTGWATVQLAVEGMKLGASDFIAKPWDNRQLLASIKTILSLRSKNTIDSPIGFDHIIGNDPALLGVLAMAKRVAGTKASVLITGESGTGKELVAEAIHIASERADKAFVKVNLGGVSASLFESEMFGHVKGAFTDAHSNREGRFSVADKGTIFLDEIGELPLASQVKLLRVLQEQTFEVLGSSKQKQIDVRVISATNKNLPQLVNAGEFREDLLYRINLITIQLPALRERPGDIPLLVEHFLAKISENYERNSLKISKEAKSWLKQQSFPGNIRQLKNLVERTVLLANTEQLEIEDFAKNLRITDQNNKNLINVDADVTLEELEIKAVKRAMSLYQQNISAAARSLGITRSALYRRLQKYGIQYEA